MNNLRYILTCDKLIHITCDDLQKNIKSKIESRYIFANGYFQLKHHQTHAL